MKHSALLYLILTLFVLFFITIGFVRDFVFQNVNYQLYLLYYAKEPVDMPQVLRFITDLPYEQLSRVKWVLTAIFASIYILSTVGLVYVIYKNKQLLLWTLLSFGILIVISCLFYLGGYMVGAKEQGYEFARIFMGIVQSPIVVMVLIPAFKLLPATSEAEHVD